MITDETLKVANSVRMAVLRANMPGWISADCWGSKPADMIWQQHGINAPSGFFEIIEAVPDPKMAVREIVSRRIARDVCVLCNGRGSVHVTCKCPHCDGEHMCVCGGEKNEEGQYVYITAPYAAVEPTVVGVQAAFGALLDGYDLFVKEFQNIPMVCAYKDGGPVAYAAALKDASLRG